MELYCLPSVFELFNAPPSKAKWKDLLNKSVNSVIVDKWRNEIEKKSSLKYVNPEVIKVNKCHPIWSNIRNSVNDSRRAQLKCKLLTGTYILQANRAVYNQYQVDPACKFCSAASETRQHFVAECSVYENERNIFKQRMANYTASCKNLQDSATSVVVDFLFIVTPIVGVCNCSMFCCTLLYVHSSIAIILMGKGDLVALLNLSSWCLIMVERLFLTVQRGCLRFVIVVFPDHTHYFTSFSNGC